MIDPTPDTHPIFKAALDFAKAGRPVFPLVPEGKAPLTPRGFHDATTAPDQIWQWWHNTPDAGLGLPTGDGLAVLDVDTHSGGGIDPKAWPPTRMAHTRSGGFHLYYAVDRPVPCSVGRVRPGVDVRGEGGYVVAPPTPGWEWANDLTVAPVDPTLLTPLRLAPGAEDWDPFLQAEEPIWEGGRNDYLARFAGWLVHLGLHNYDDLLDAVERENQRIVQPPLDDPELRQIVRSIRRYR